MSKSIRFQTFFLCTQASFYITCLDLLHTMCEESRCNLVMVE